MSPESAGAGAGRTCSLRPRWPATQETSLCINTCGPSRTPRSVAAGRAGEAVSSPHSLAPAAGCCPPPGVSACTGTRWPGESFRDLPGRRDRQGRGSSGGSKELTTTEGQTLGLPCPGRPGQQARGPRCPLATARGDGQEPLGQAGTWSMSGARKRERGRETEAGGRGTPWPSGRLLSV